MYFSKRILAEFFLFKFTVIIIARMIFSNLLIFVENLPTYFVSAAQHKAFSGSLEYSLMGQVSLQGSSSSLPKWSWTRSHLDNVLHVILALTLRTWSFSSDFCDKNCKMLVDNNLNLN